MTAKDKSFIHGVAAALACVSRDFDQPTLAKEVLVSIGVTREMLTEADVDPEDLDALKDS
jgi:hypothetical protein